MQRFQDKVIVVTGGNSGIGKGIAKAFSEAGGKVVISGRDMMKLQAAQATLDNESLVLQCDVTKSEALKNLFTKTENEFGKCDVLVINSGVGERLHIDDVTEAGFDKLVLTNYRGAYFTVKHALPHLNNNAVIIFIASVAASITLRNQGVYASSKAAIVKLSQNLSYDLAPRGIRVNCISPGYILTPIFDSRLACDPDYLKKREAHIPLQRIGTPQDIANAVMFLASEDASYITGVNLLVDGGYAASFREAE